ncbi:hypothetical protein B0A50_04185 [Salinomyces thailandicus]|uniref:Uncharacterized protein n=1 Tax=Salinomyces thailandicus TaxID=706561 RepID=A0A4U0U026_9PEZI|nr:hypothetical protein B0A50_04185 [Salinomyces thailandica]
MHHLPRAFRLRQQHHLPRHLLQPRLQHHRQFTQLLRRFRPQSVFTRDTGEPLRKQTVRFKKPPFFTWRRAFTTALYAGVFYYYLGAIFRHLDIEVELLDDETLAKEEEEARARNGQDVTAEEEGEEEDEGPFYAEEDSLFIPLTWATKMPRTFYRGSDPEWQDFLRIAKDSTRHKKIQDELVQVIYTGAIQHPTISRQLGSTPKVGKYWLDISFPDAPPQEYERAGLEIGEGFIAWSRQKVSQEEQWRLMRALWPSAAFNSLWATGKVLGGLNIRRVKQALGWEERDPLSPEERYRTALEIMEKRQQARERKGLGGSSPQTPDGLSGDLVSGAAANTPNSLSKPPTATSTPTPTSSPDLPWHLPTPPMPPASLTTAAARTDLPIAMQVFSHTLTSRWKPSNAEPPRGTFVVQGLVEVRGQRGRMLFDVRSCYDPKAGKYVVVNAAVRGWKRWNQSPRGGP